MAAYRLRQSELLGSHLCNLGLVEHLLSALARRSGGDKTAACYLREMGTGQYLL